MCEFYVYVHVRVAFVVKLFSQLNITSLDRTFSFVFLYIWPGQNKVDMTNIEPAQWKMNSNIVNFRLSPSFLEIFLFPEKLWKIV